jgi:hypothetical protein
MYSSYIYIRDTLFLIIKNMYIYEFMYEYGIHMTNMYGHEVQF